MPWASAPKAPWVEVWLSPQTIVVPGRVKPCSGPMMWTMPCRGVELVVIFDAELARVPGQFLDLLAALRIGDAAAAVGGLDVVVDDGERLFRRAHLAARQAQPLERLRARHLMDEVAVDVDEAGAAGGVDDMVIPDLVVQRTRLGHNALQRPCGREFRGDLAAIYAGWGADGRGDRAEPAPAPRRAVSSSAPAKAMHWFVAAAVVVLLALGPAMKRLVPEGSLRDNLYTFHEALGALVLIVMVVRLVRRLAFGVPAPDASMPLLASSAARSGRILTRSTSFFSSRRCSAGRGPMLTAIRSASSACSIFACIHGQGSARCRIRLSFGISSAGFLDRSWICRAPYRRRALPLARQRRWRVTAHAAGELILRSDGRSARAGHSHIRARSRRLKTEFGSKAVRSECRSLRQPKSRPRHA